MKRACRPRAFNCRKRQAWSALLAVFCSTSLLPAQSEDQAAFNDGDVMRGWRVFHDKKCVACHAIWDQGASVGPDLGRIRAERLTAGQLGGVMWNHIPKMLGQMEQSGRPPTSLSRDEMADLFSLIFFVRRLDALGDPGRGEQILREKGCSECHETGGRGGSVGPDLAKWSEYSNPIIWAQLMWEHAPLMEEAMRRADVTWPRLEGSDLVHIVAFVRSVGATGKRNYLLPGSTVRGRELFIDKKCNICHPGTGPDLQSADLPTSVGALASRMWNHSPAMMRVMQEEDVARLPISPQELADVLTYVLALGTVDSGGDPVRGANVFVRKGCVECHERNDEADLSGPAVADLRHYATPVDMAAAMWNHGQTMLQSMAEAGLSWPVFIDDEMEQLLAYLESPLQSGSPSEGGP